MSQTAHHHATSPAKACPYCGHEITREEFLAIEARLAKEQQEKFDVLAKRLNAKHMAELSEARKALVAKDQEAQGQLKVIQEAHREELAARDRATEKQLAAALKSERAKWEGEAQAEKAKLEQARVAFETDRKAFESTKAAAKKAHEEALNRQREVLNADHERKLLEQKAASEKVNHRLQQKLEDMTRQLEKKSNEELGDGAEVNLYNDLKRAFPDDVIDRVKRGGPGADIKHKIDFDGRICGKIVYDSKNRADWKKQYAEQLRKDQIAEKADYAILATRKFPRNAREMAVQSGVILVNPARACVIARVLREALVQLSSVKLSEKGKIEKRRELYDFVTSTRCATLFARVEGEVRNLRELDEKERAQQEKIRKDRSKHVGEIEKTVIGELQREIHRILGV